MSNITRLPGVGCTYYLRGRCLYAERINPGLDRSLACIVVTRWADNLDDFLGRAEAMGVEQSSVAAIWQSRIQEMLPEIRLCERFQAGDEPWECVHLDELLCVRALPVCLGRCRRFTVARDEINNKS